MHTFTMRTMIQSRMLLLTISMIGSCSSVARFQKAL